MYTYLPTYLYISICLYIYLPTDLCGQRPVSLSIYICTSTYLPTYPYIYLSIYMPIDLPTYLPQTTLWSTSAQVAHETRLERNWNKTRTKVESACVVEGSLDLAPKGCTQR